MGFQGLGLDHRARVVRRGGQSLRSGAHGVMSRARGCWRCCRLDGAGIGMGFAMANQMGGMMGGGQQRPATESKDQIMTMLKQLGELKAAGILTDAEFESKKKELLAKL